MSTDGKIDLYPYKRSKPRYFSLQKPFRRVITQSQYGPPTEPVQSLEIRQPKLVDPAVKLRRGRRLTQGVVDWFQNRPAHGHGGLRGGWVLLLHERAPVATQDQHAVANEGGLVGRGRAVVARHAKVDASRTLGLCLITLRFGLGGLCWRLGFSSG